MADEISEYLRRPVRSLEQYLDDLYWWFEVLPDGDPRLAPLSRLIGLAEDELNAREGF